MEYGVVTEPGVPKIVFPFDFNFLFFVPSARGVAMLSSGMSSQSAFTPVESEQIWPLFNMDISAGSVIY